MKNLIFELAKVDRRAALIFKREIKLRIKRGELSFEFLTRKQASKKKLKKVKTILHLLDSFNWEETRQGHEYWNHIFASTYKKGR